MSKSSKNYVVDLSILAAKAADIAKLPKQQQIILKAMSECCTETGMKGSDIIAHAVKNHGLETRQKYTVLYAWYARSNELYGVSVQKTKVEEPSAPVVEEKPARKAKHA